MADVEGLGYDAGVWVAPKSQRAGLRGLRNADGDLIYASSLQAGGQATSLWGSPIYWAYASTWTSDGDAKFLVADPELVVIGIRKDIEIRPFDQGVITDNDGNVIHNLMQDDMVALRVRARYGFNWANVATPDNPTPDDDAGVPFSVVIDAA
jgi:HK97 family phage major capsid protein